MAHTYDLATDIGKVRLLIGDNDIVPVTDAHFTDEELQTFLMLAGSVNLAAAMALESWAATLSEAEDSERIGDYSYSQKSVQNKLDLAKRLRDNEGGTPAVAIAAFNFTGVEDTD